MTRNTRIVVVNHREIPAGLIVDEVLGFRRFAEAEFTGEAPPTVARCERYLAGAFRRGAGAVAGHQPAQHPGKPGVRGGGGMSAAEATPRSPLPLLLGLATLLLVASGVAYYLMQARPAERAQGVPLDALYGLALDADGAVAGDAGALGRFQERQKQLEEAAARDPAAPFASDARYARLMNNATAVLRARSALADAGSAAHDTSTLVPQLLAEAGALAASLPPASAAQTAGVLERFEGRAQRLQLDVAALTQGAADPGQAAQHIAESTDYLGQVISAFAGGTSAIALPKVTAPDSAKYLKALDAIYADLNAAVKRAVAAAPALPAAQTAARAIVADARDLAAAAATPAGVPAGAGLGTLPAAAAAGRGARVPAGRPGRGAAHAPHGRAPAPVRGRAAQGNRPQPAGHPAPAR